MNVTICTDDNQWKKLINAQENSHFLQSWGWGAFQKSVGHEPMRLCVENDQQVFPLQGFVHSPPGPWQYVYFPRVPGYTSKVWDSALMYLSQKGYTFVRVEPTSLLPHVQPKTLEIKHLQPGSSLILSLTDTADALLDAMHKKTRYNIRYAKRKGVDVRQEKHAEIFADLNAETTARDEFSAHPKAYYEKFLLQDFAHQFTAYFKKQPIASIICVKFGDTMTYVHGASSNSHRNVMAPYLLQWEAILFAKEQGCKQYDFWGIAPIIAADASGKITTFHEYTWQADHDWSGITRFKVGFGGNPVQYPPAQDIVLQPLRYRLYQAIRSLRNRIS